ncbi:MAG TPA: winged helix-turn-helix domain-containing protein [Pyrinomonadaceae bacterium]|jgi:DNA-binding response OmpR family regulator
MNRAALNADENIYDDGHLRVEHDNYYVACDGYSLRLPLKEFLILSRLTLHPGRVVPSEEIWRYAWGGDEKPNTQTIHVQIYRLRRKLAHFGLKIIAMINVGYSLDKNHLVEKMRDNDG